MAGEVVAGLEDDVRAFLAVRLVGSWAVVALVEEVEERLLVVGLA